MKDIKELSDAKSETVKLANAAELTKKQLRTAFELVPVDVRLTLFISLCYTVTLMNNKDLSGEQIYDLTWKMLYFYMSSFGVLDLIKPLIEAIEKEPDGSVQ